MTNPFVRNDVYFETGEKFQRNITGKELGGKLLNGLRSSFKKFNFVYIFAVIFIIFMISSARTLNWNLVTNILYSTVTVGVIAIGMGLIVLTGEIDLSVGSSFAMVGGLSVLTYNQALASTGNEGLSMFITLIVAVGLGCFVGFINGFLIGKLKMPGFIVTLATMLIFRSLTLYFLSLVPGNPSTYRVSGYGNDVWYNLGNSKVIGIAYVGIIFILIGVLVWLITKYTKYGRKIYAVGSNPKAASLVGIKADWIKVSVFVFAGALIGISSFLHMAMYNNVDPSTTGKSFELYAIASVVIGGIAMSGGRGSIIGVIFGALAFQSIDKIISALRLTATLNDTIKGVILIVAVAIQVIRISKEDMVRYLEKLNIIFSLDKDLLLESELKQKVDELEEKYSKMILKINSNKNLNENEVESKINLLLDEKENQISLLSKKYAIKIDDAKLKIARIIKQKEVESKIKEFKNKEENSKHYIAYSLKKAKVELEPYTSKVLERELALEVNHALLVQKNNEAIKQLYEEFYNLLKEQSSHLLQRDNENGVSNAKESFEKRNKEIETSKEKAISKLVYVDVDLLNKKYKEEISKELALEPEKVKVYNENKTKKDEILKEKNALKEEKQKQKQYLLAKKEAEKKEKEEKQKQEKEVQDKRLEKILNNRKTK